MSSVSLDLNPCVSCGACCASFRAAFYWGEGDDSEGGTVPIDLVEDLPPFRRVMKGTNQPNPRCIALDGEIGKCVSCRIYEKRSTTCRAFPFSWQEGQHNPDCDKARMLWGLLPLEASSFEPLSLAQTLSTSEHLLVEEDVEELSTTTPQHAPMLALPSCEEETPLPPPTTTIKRPTRQRPR